MPKVKRPYSRVYWEVLDDDKFADVWGDDRALATWLRLLIAADMAWPASAQLYHGVHRASLEKLCRVRLVDMQQAGRYRIHGLDKEREARSDVARDAVSHRYGRSTPVEQAYSDDDGMGGYARTTNGLPSQDEPSRAKTSKAKQEQNAPAFDVMILVEDLTRRPFNYREGHQVHDTLVGDVAAHGAEAMSSEYRRFRESSPGPVDAAQLVFGVHNALHPLTKPTPVRPETPKEVGERLSREFRERRAKESPDAVA